MKGRRISHIEALVDDFRVEVSWKFAEFVHAHRLAGKTYREIAENEGLHPSTVRRYVLCFDRLKSQPGYGSAADREPSCNALSLVCVACGDTFTSARADARYCTDACRQDAYRKRKLGAVAA